MTGTKYKNVSLPEEMVKTVQDFIESNPSLGFKGVPEFVKDSVRRRLEEFEEFERKKAPEGEPK